MNNEIEVTILPDGRLRIVTGSMKGVHHVAADNLVKGLDAALIKETQTPAKKTLDTTHNTTQKGVQEQ